MVGRNRIPFNSTMRIKRICLGLIFAAVPVVIFAADGVVRSGMPQMVTDTGTSGLWILANVSYAGMRAQNNPSSGWRILAFIFGFPGTLITYLAVTEGSDRAYGISIPARR